MDLLYTRRFDGFCLVSSDSDFTELAVRIREEGLMVYGFGEQKTPEAFRNACHKFLFTEVLRPVAAPKGKPLGIAKSKKKGPMAGAPAASANGTGSPPAPQPPPLAAMNEGRSTEEDAFFRQAFEQVSDEQGWAHLGQFGNYLKKLRPDFDARNFGYKKLSDLVRARADLFEVVEREVAGTTTSNLYIRTR
jgi:OST-HTH/LOTUS domain/NYN domain